MERLSNWLVTLCSISRCGSSVDAWGMGADSLGIVTWETRGCCGFKSCDWNWSFLSFCLAHCKASWKVFGNFPFTFSRKDGRSPSKNFSICRRSGVLSPCGRLASHSVHILRNWALYVWYEPKVSCWRDEILFHSSLGLSRPPYSAKKASLILSQPFFLSAASPWNQVFAVSFKTRGKALTLTSSSSLPAIIKAISRSSKKFPALSLLLPEKVGYAIVTNAQPSPWILLFVFFQNFVLPFFSLFFLSFFSFPIRAQRCTRLKIDDSKLEERWKALQMHWWRPISLHQKIS